MAKGLRIARGFELPLEMVTEATAIVATRGAGKSSASAVMVEEAHDADVQCVVFDRTGVYHGLRSNRKGDGPGLPIYVLGGPHGDVPLEAHAGSLIADVVVDTGHSFVLDLSDLSKSAAIRFAAAMLERLYDRKARSRSTLLVVMDEAHFYAPQTPRGGFKGDGARLMGAMEDMVGLGRSRGLGVVLTTQRTQALNKAILDLIETLLVMRMLSPRARDAVQDWIREKQEDDREGVIGTLDSLPTGTAWVWAPVRGILERVALRRIRTFDSYYTPKPGEAPVEPTVRRELDLTALGEQMQATAERAKADDPAELRKRIRELEAELAQRPDAEPETVEVRVEVPVPFVPPDVELHARTVIDAVQAIVTASDSQQAAAEQLLDLVREAPTVPEAPAARPTPPSHPPKRAAAPPKAPPKSEPSAGELSLGKAHRAILTVLAQHPEGRSKMQLATQTGYSHNGGGFNNPLGALRTAGYVTRGEPIQATQEGLLALGTWDELPTGRALLAHWLAHPQLGQAHAAILEVLAASNGAGLSKEELAERAGMHARGQPYEPNGGGFNNPLGKLRTLGLVAKGQPIRLSDEFAEAIR